MASTLLTYIARIWFMQMDLPKNAPRRKEIDFYVDRSSQITEIVQLIEKKLKLGVYMTGFFIQWKLRIRDSKIKEKVPLTLNRLFDPESTKGK